MPVIGDKPHVVKSRDAGESGSTSGPGQAKAKDADGAPDTEPNAGTFDRGTRPIETSGVMKVGADAPGAGGNAVLRRATLEGQVPSAEKGPEALPKPEVTRVLGAYGVTERLGRPRERIAGWVARVHDDLMAAGAEDKGPAALAEQLLADDVRLQVFYLEGALKLYRKRYGGEAEDVYDKVKSLEDHLGRASGARSQLAMAKEHPAVPQAAVDWLKEQVQVHDAALVKVLAEEWTPDDQGRFGALSDVVRFLTDTDWDDYKDDKKYLVGELNRRLKKCQKKDYDMSVLQGDFGVHELRRDLRWFPIYAVALDGAIQLSDERNPIKEYKDLLGTDLVNSKYAQVPEGGREKDPVAFSHSLYLRNTELITELGGLKDQGEEIEAIAFALEGAGLYDDAHQALQTAAKTLGLDDDANDQVHERAAEIFAELEGHDYFKAMRDEVRGR